MTEKNDLQKTMNKNQRQLLGKLRGSVKDLNSVLKLIADCQDVDAIRREHMEFLGIVGTRSLSESELSGAKEGGIPFDELRRMCCRKIDASLAGETVRESLPQGHCLRMIFAEHEIILYHVSDLDSIVKELQKVHSWDNDRKLISRAVTVLKNLVKADSHRAREEQAIFPQLESCGFNQVPRMLKSEHGAISRATIELRNLLDSVDMIEYKLWFDRLARITSDYVPLMRKHIKTEESVLYPSALKLIQDPVKWADMKNACDEIGISCL